MSTPEKATLSLASFEHFSAALEALPAALVVYDASDKLMICNRAYKQFYYPFEEEVRPGVSHEELQWLKVREGLDKRAIGRPDEFVAEEIARHRTGPSIEEWRDDNGRYVRMLRARIEGGLTVGMRFDITDLRRAQLSLEEQNKKLAEAHKKAHRQATVDDLTGLTNRRASTEKLHELKEVCRRTGQALALLHIDLDGFKQVNDTHGHAAGDFVLVEVAKRLRKTVRKGDLLARIGGDEFIIAMTCAPTSRDPEIIAGRLIEDLRQPVEFGERPCMIGASVGIAMEPAEDLDPERLAVSADVALYKSKENGRNRCTVFDDELRAQSAMKASIASALMTEDLTSQLEAFFQPTVTADTHELVSVEALVRWRHPALGLLPPDRFLDVGEKLKIMSDIDAMMLDFVLQHRKGWVAQGLDVPRIAVNVSSQRLRDPDLLSQLGKLDIPCDALSFEVLETVFSDRDTDMLRWNIDGLHEMGIELQIDDYGTAHSSISGLLLIRPQRLKIDRRFTANLLESEQSEAIVRLTVAMSHALGIEVTAEGVETAAHAEKLRALECDRLQGYLFGAPMQGDAFAALLQEPVAQAR